ncbi:hypothetical protein QTP88_023422 [Uroleucon formosanum]
MTILLIRVDRQIIFLELKQFASQFKNFLPDLSSSDLNYKNNTNTQTESSNDIESEDESPFIGLKQAESDLHVSILNVGKNLPVGLTTLV